jgi:ERF superfamily
MTQINLLKALLEFQKNVPNIPLDAKNNHLHNRYASLPSILNTINNYLCDAGLVIMQHPSTEDDYIKLQTFVFHAETGEHFTSELKMKPEKTTPQSAGACLTYMRRYALVSVLKLNADDDDDGNAASGVTAPKKSYKPPITPLPTPKKSVTPELFDAWSLDLSQASSLDDLKSIYSRIIIDLRKNYSNVQDVENKLEIIKDEIKGTRSFINVEENKG